MDKDSQKISKKLLSPSPIQMDDDKEEFFKIFISLFEKYTDLNDSETIENTKKKKE